MQSDILQKSLPMPRTISSRTLQQHVKMLLRCKLRQQVFKSLNCLHSTVAQCPPTLFAVRLLTHISADVHNICSVIFSFTSEADSRELAGECSGGKEVGVQTIVDLTVYCSPAAD